MVRGSGEVDHGQRAPGAPKPAGPGVWRMALRPHLSWSVSLDRPGILMLAAGPLEPMRRGCLHGLLVGAVTRSSIPATVVALATRGLHP